MNINIFQKIMKNNHSNQKAFEPENIQGSPAEGRNTKVTVHFPDEIGIELVQANELRHYEIFQWLVVLVAPIAVGFWTAYVTDAGRSGSLWWSALAFSAIAVFFIFAAIYYRRKVFHGSVTKTILLSDFE